MKDIEIKNLWKTYDEKLDQVLSINQKLATEITKTKAMSALARAKPMKIFGIVVGIPWIIFLGTLLMIGILRGGIFFTSSVAAIMVITIISLTIYIYHLILINQVNNTDSVVEAQEKMAKIKTSSIRGTRIAFLQLPFWTTFHLNMAMFENPNLLLIGVQVLITVLFTFAAIWLYKNISLENMNKKWMKLLFSGREWDSVVRAIGILDQIEGYTKPV